jgi:natural product biosynthesis luciferase-like monooxygenase protein
MATRLSDNLQFLPEAVYRPSTLVELLRWRATQMAEQQAYTYLIDDERKQSFTYAELDRYARVIGAALQRQGATGERVLLLYPPGLEFIAAFFGCLYAGAVAVPAYPPRLNRSFRRLVAIVADAEATFALTTTPILSKVKALLGEPNNGLRLEQLRWLDTNALTLDAAEDWFEPAGLPDRLAFLQYTSGSTGTPKGVMLTHHNLLHNASLVYYGVDHQPGDRYVSWLPTFHDMGFMAGVLQPLYGGFEVVLMSPLAFLQNPYRWLQTISHYRGTTSGGPSFAYELCVQKITPEQRETLDLSSWSVAFNGAEPIRHETMERFTKTFEPFGFRHETFYPCYGMAEATLIVSGGHKSNPPVIKTVQAKALEHHQVIEAAGQQDEPVRALVGCGVSFPGQEIAIVDPESHIVCAPNEVGEIWVSGPSIAQGYWNNPVETKRTFQAHLASAGHRPFLRTGDLGFMQDGELFVTGRLKDMIIIRGLNHYPQDIELTVEQCNAALRSGCGAAFSIEEAGEERLVAVQEVDWRQHPDCEALIKNIRQAVSEEHEVQLHAVVLIKPKSIPKTSSGKIQRHACRASFLARDFDVIAEWRETDEAPPERSDKTLPGAASLEEWLRAELAAKLGIAAQQIDANEPIMRYGLDSLTAVELVQRIDLQFGVNLPVASLLESPSIAQLVEQALSASLSLPEKNPVSSAAETSAVHQLSHGQQALWFLHQLAPESAAYNIASAVRIEGRLDIPSLKWAFQALSDRHAALRTTFPRHDGKPVQQVHESQPVHFEVIDVSAWNQRQLDEQLVEQALHPFDLEHGPLMRVSIFARRSSEHFLLLAIHHLIADFWSLQVLVGELRALYAERTIQGAAALPPLDLQYTDYVRWQADLLASPEGEQLWRYWETQLAGGLPVLNLPTDRPRPPVQTYRGASHALALDDALTRRLKALAQDECATLYMTLLAAFQVLLARYTGQEEILVGSPMAGRSRAPFAHLIGYFVNPVVLRANLSENPSFAEFLQQVRQTVCAAFAHQDWPFAALVERLQPERDPSRSPLFQVMFSLQRDNSLGESELAPFALGEAGAQLFLGDLRLESLALEQRVAQFDLTVMMAETGGRLAASFQYNADLFEATTINRMAEHFHALLNSIVDCPTEAIRSLPLLTETERRGLFGDWDETRTEYPEKVCIHELFEAQAEKTPEADAIVFEGIRLSYRELNRRANQVAHHLRRLGVGADVLVGVCVERSWEMMVGLLGILKAGGAYVPLDPTYPKERLAMMLEDAQAPVLLTQNSLARSFGGNETRIVCLDADWDAIAREGQQNPDCRMTSDDLAYVIYTSGSTGKPKGVMIPHRSVVNFFAGMDSRVGCTAADTMLAVTSISFDISVLELLWTLTRGARVVVLSEAAAHGLTQPKRARIEKSLGYSLFYFANADSNSPQDKYRLLLEGARFADQHGYEAVWTPERHFHAFGGLYPNPSVTGAALAAVTRQIGIRAGSVVMPLHNPLRVAEEWSVVDNLSNGRVGISFASGWHADDFTFFPDQYADRKELMYRGIEIVKRLWSGESIAVRGGAGNEIKVRIYPQPVQPTLPIWITAAGIPDTFIRAGEIGANVLTHLLGQSLEEVVQKIKLYRDSLARHGHDPKKGRVTLMLHTYLDEDLERVRQKVRVPFTNYLRTSVGLIANLAKSLNTSLDLNNMSARDMDDLLAYAFDRYFETSALFGTPRSCLAMIDQLKEMGVDEVACLIDFGIEAEASLAGLQPLSELRERSSQHSASADYSLAAQAVRYDATLMQCTPSMMQMLSLNQEVMDSLRSLRVLLLGGEALPPSLAKQVKSTLPCRLLNMYGPTETTIWSMVHEIDEAGSAISIGRPIANTQIHILDRYGQPVPTGVAGELCIGGDGLARGYFNRDELTAEKFVYYPLAQLGIADLGLKEIPLSSNAHPGMERSKAIANSLNSHAARGARLYRTGDLAYRRPDGNIEFLGRMDHQVKIRGFRVELGEIEAVLAEHADVRETVVLAREDIPGDKRLVAYVVAGGKRTPASKELRTFLKEKLPDYMIPAHFVTLEALPWTANGKINRKALPAVSGLGSDLTAEYVAPQTGLEQAIAGVWQQVLNLEKVGVHDNFFDLGGQSLLLAQAHSQLRDLLRKDFPLVKMLEHPTVSALARNLNQSQNLSVTFEQSQDRARKHRAGLLRQRQTVVKSRS